MATNSGISIEITDKDILETIWHFAETVNKTTEYSNRGQSDMRKRQFDQVVGKVAEEAVSIAVNAPRPDYAIYTGKRKSFAADLHTVNGTAIHVKAQCLEQAERFGASWCFQGNDKIVTAPTGKELIVICLVDFSMAKFNPSQPPKSIKVHVLGYITDAEASQQMDYPKSQKLRELGKRALYLDDVRGLLKAVA